MPDWSIWLIAAGVLGIGEIVTLGFFLGPVAIAAAIASIAAAAGAAVELQFTVFIVATIASLLVVRPIAVRHLRQPARIRTGTEALIGSRALVTDRVSQDGGSVKIGGEVWTARTFDEDDVFEEGQRVEVVKIEGATALVQD